MFAAIVQIGTLVEAIDCIPLTHSYQQQKRDPQFTKFSFSKIPLLQQMGSVFLNPSVSLVLKPQQSNTRTQVYCHVISVKKYIHRTVILSRDITRFIDKDSKRRMAWPSHSTLQTNYNTTQKKK